ncbi:glycosyltransferase family 2 protein [Sphingomonas solaris]|uniref:Glycosyltransferase family 2 protein n=1 Tax=Alterirhizorhabdus solaris TaxID=2529389 RepID=A0A558R6X3_9SPHN|nr:glycosyltransferase family A protein [Sphingomonas solaris]TVV75135.1 glycosyltransferase family 2 protein [Sphingomonas solaris]
MSRISCIMASRGAAFPARLAIECYRRQSWADRELIVVSADRNAAVAGLVAALGDPSIRFIAAPPDTPVGPLRNLGIAAATGELIAVWDDDDLCHPERLAWQHEAMAARDAVACMIGRVLLWWPERRRLAAGAWRTWENSLLARRDAMPAYSARPRGSDTEVVDTLRALGPPALVERLDAYLYVVHGGNLWGADHFEMLFANAAELAPADYDAAIAALGRHMPLTACLRGYGLSAPA